MRIFGIDYTSLCTLMLISACLATNTLEIKIFLLCNSRKFPRVILQEIALRFQDECIINMAQRRSARTVSDPWTAKIRAPFVVFSQPLIYPMAKYLLLRMILWDPSNLILPRFVERGLPLPLFL